MEWVIGIFIALFIISNGYWLCVVVKYFVDERKNKRQVKRNEKKKKRKND